MTMEEKMLMDAIGAESERDKAWRRLRNYALWLHTDEHKSWSEVITELERTYTSLESRLLVNGQGLRGLKGKVLWHLYLMTHTTILLHLFFGSGAWLGLLLLIVGMSITAVGIGMTLFHPSAWALVAIVAGAALFCCGVSLRRNLE